MSSASYIDDMLVESPEDLHKGTREVASFYANRNVLLTGGSGFLGKLVIEKILRSCEDVRTLFLLVRAKKGKTPEERLEELFKDEIFDRLKKERPGFIRKVVLIGGDLTEADLGLSSENEELLRSTHIVIHGAATVRFDEKLKIALSINLRGTRALLELAKEMKDLKAFVHVSTAYSNCTSDVIEEKFYPPPMDSEKLLAMLDLLDDECLDHLTPVLLGKWPNTYAFTKAAAEDTVRRNCQGLPLCVVRPSIVISTAKEPLAGWINNFYGPTGIVLGAAIGLLRTLHCNGDLLADMIPADYVVDTIVVAAWDIGKTHSDEANTADSSKVPKFEDPPIYNVVSSPQRPIKWKELMTNTEESGIEVPSMMCVWYYCLTLNKSRWIHNLYVFFLHFIPAGIIDSFSWLVGRPPMMWATYKKIHKFSAVVEYFTLQEWKFRNENAQQLCRRLSPADSAEYNLDIEKLNWKEYSYYHVRGLRKYLLKDTIDTLEQARVKYRRMKMAHYTLITVVSGILLWLLLMILRLVGLFLLY